MLGRPLAQHCGGDLCQVFGSDPTSACIAPENRETTAHRGSTVEQIFHEDIGVQVGPCDATGLDVLLYHGEPHKVGIGTIPLGKHTLVDDVFHASLVGSIHQCLALMHHGD